MSASVPSLDLIRRLAERRARSELATHGRVTPSAEVFYGCASDIIYANEGESWQAFVEYTQCEREKLGGHAAVLYSQRAAGADVSLTILPRDGVPIELSVSATMVGN